MKPIAWYDPSNGVVSTDKDCPLFTPLGQVWALYPQPEQEPVAYDYRIKYDRGCYKCDSQFCPGNCIDTTPPQRPWVGLTDEQRSQLVTLHHGWNEYGQAIEAALRSKNHD